MSGLLEALAGERPAVRVIVAETRGSAPREAGAAMLVSATGVSGTIGGGALEYEAIALARAMLAETDAETDAKTGGWRRRTAARPLGPALGQCCGGHVRLWFERIGAEAVAPPSAARLSVRPSDDVAPVYLAPGDPLDALPRPVAQAAAAMLAGARPEAALYLRGPETGEWLIEPLRAPATPLYLYGAGHVGRALARVLEGLPLALRWVDIERARYPEPPPAHAEILPAPDPSTVAALAPGGAIHLVMTHSHALDFAICDQLLRRGDFLQLGLIGSATKRARFRARLAALGHAPAAIDRLTCPIGVGGIADKRPEAIAIGAAAQTLHWIEAAATESGALEADGVAAARRA